MHALVDLNSRFTSVTYFVAVFDNNILMNKYMLTYVSTLAL